MCICGLLHEFLNLFGISLVNEGEQKDLELPNADVDATDVSYKKIGKDYSCCYTWSNKIATFKSKEDPVFIIVVKADEELDQKNSTWFPKDIRKLATHFYEEIHLVLHVRYFLNSRKKENIEKDDSGSDEGGQGPTPSTKNEYAEENYKSELPQEGLLKESTNRGASTAMKGCLGQEHLTSNQEGGLFNFSPVHDAPVKTVHWIKAPNYSCVMTGSWDKTLKFWDTRTPNPMLTINLPERCYCADVFYPMAVVGTAGRGIIVYQLESQPQEFKKIESPLKYQHRCVSIFLDKKGAPCGFALGSVEGRVAIQYVNPQNPKDNFTFKCHRSNGTTNGYQDIYAVNDISFHPVHGTLATVGSDGRFSFWDKDARTKLKTSEQLELAITRCCFNARGEIFAYSVSYDWSKGHEFYNPQKKNYIFLHPCYEELKPRNKK